MTPKKGFKHPGKAPKGKLASEVHKQSIWDSSFIPDWAKPATEEEIRATEQRLSVKIPEVLRAQLRVQNGGSFLTDEAEDVMSHVGWSNAAVDGIRPVEEWHLAKCDNWFDAVKGVKALDLLVIITAHSESQLCLDYRSHGRDGTPAVTYVDVCATPIEIASVCGSIDDFVAALIDAKLRAE